MGMCAEDKYKERKTCKDVPPAPKCVEQGNKCTYNQKCCGDNLICSADGFGGEMTCKESNQEPKCIAEGDECDDELKCCDDLTCASNKGIVGDCDLAMSFDSEECKKTCHKEKPPAPVEPTEICSKKGDKCSYKQKCCDDNMICSA